MLSNEKAMYQAYLIIQNLPENEKKLISEEDMGNLKSNMVIDENININPEIDLQKQKIDDKTLNILDSILKKIKMNRIEKQKENLENIIKNKFDEKTFIHIKSLKELLTENYSLIEKLDSFREENQNLEEYRETLTSFKNSYEMLKKEKESLLEQQQRILKVYEKIPSIAKEVFLKNNKIKKLT